MLNRFYIRKISAITFLLIVLTIPTILFAGSDPREVIISGQVMNYEYGNSVEGHKVFIKDIGDDSDRFIRELITDAEGYYNLTIQTTELSGSYIISTRDYKNNVIDTTVHFRFVGYSAFNVIIANFNIYMPYNSPKLQARFKYTQKLSGQNRFLYKFIDLTKNENIISTIWHFGDGDTSDVKNPTHTYKSDGVYKVALTVTSKINTKVEVSTTSHLIYISDRSYYHMGGHAFAEYLPVDYGKAFLYTIDSNNNFIPVDTSYMDTLGFFLFYQIPEGKYVIKTQPSAESEQYGKMLPTYYGNTMIWQNAKIINLTQTCWEYDIHMKHGGYLESGNCNINGNVIYGDNGLNARSLTAENVDVYLFDENNNLLLSHYSDGEGAFNFSGIGAGVYYLYPEVTGIESNKQFIQLTDEVPNVDNLEIIVGNNGPNSIFDNTTETGLISNVFPNPSLSILNIEINEIRSSDLKISLFDLSGRLVYSNENVTQPIATIDVSEFETGTYLLILSNGPKIDRKLFVVAN